MPAESSRKWRADGLVPPLDRTRTIPIPSRRCRSDAQTAAAAVALKPIRETGQTKIVNCETRSIKVHHLHRRNIQDTDISYATTTALSLYVARVPREGVENKRVQNRRRNVKQTTYSLQKCHFPPDAFAVYVIHIERWKYKAGESGSRWTLIAPVIYIYIYVFWSGDTLALYINNFDSRESMMTMMSFYVNEIFSRMRTKSVREANKNMFVKMSRLKSTPKKCLRRICIL